MNDIGQPEHATQNRVIALFREELGYRYLGDWTHRDGNSNIEEGLLTAWLSKRRYTPGQISRAIYLLKTEAANQSRTLYGNNQAVYSLPPEERERAARQRAGGPRPAVRAGAATEGRAGARPLLLR